MKKYVRPWSAIVAALHGGYSVAIGKDHEGEDDLIREYPPGRYRVLVGADWSNFLTNMSLLELRCYLQDNGYLKGED
jgi:hypothetical protein